MSVFTANHRRNGVRYAESESIVEFWKLSLSSWLAWVLAVCICIMKNRAKSPKSEGSLCIFSEIVGWGNTWYCCVTSCPTGFPDSSVGKESACNAGDLGLIPGLGRSPGEGKGYPRQYSGLENSMDFAVHGVTKSWTRLSDFHFQKVGKCKKRRNSLLWLEPFCFSLWYRIQFCIKVEMLVAQLCPTHCDLMDSSSPGSSVHEISQAKIQE